MSTPVAVVARFTESVAGRAGPSPAGGCDAPGTELVAPITNLLLRHPRAVQPRSVERPELLAEFVSIGDDRRTTR